MEREMGEVVKRPQSPLRLTLWGRNPASNQINVISTIANYDRVEIYNLNGQKILEFTNVSGTQSLNIAILPSGLYVLAIVPSETMDYTKFIKQ